MKGKEEQLNKVLMQVAKGCCTTEVTEEYAEVDGEMRLTKRKETRREIPPDLKAVQMLLGKGADEKEMSDEQLEEERQRLLETLLAVQKKEKTKKQGEKKCKKKQ